MGFSLKKIFGGGGGYDWLKEIKKSTGRDSMVESGKRIWEEIDRLRNQAHDPKLAGVEKDTLDQYQTNRYTGGAIKDDALDDLRRMAGDSGYEDEMFKDIERLRGSKAFDELDWGPGGDVPMVSARDVRAQQIGRDQMEDVEFSDERADVSALRDFDPDAAFQRYSAGAKMGMDQSLEDAFKSLTATRAGQGRFTSGFFGLDAGDVGRGINREYQSGVLQKALETAALKQKGLTDMTQISADDLARIREGKLSASTSNAGNVLEMLRANQSTDLAAQQSNQGADISTSSANQDAFFRTKAFNRSGILDQADASARLFGQMVGSRNARMGATGDAAGFQRGDRDFDYGVFADEQDRLLNSAKMRRDDRDYVQGGNERAQDRYLDWLSGSTDRFTGAQNAKDQRKANWRGQMLGLAGQIGGAAIGAMGGGGAGAAAGASRVAGANLTMANSALDTMPRPSLRTTPGYRRGTYGTSYKSMLSQDY